MSLLTGGPRKESGGGCGLRGGESGVTFQGETGGWPSPETARGETDLQDSVK